MRKRVVPLLVWGLLGTAVPTFADPVRIVTRGIVDSHEGDSTFSLAGNGFAVGGEIFGIDSLRGRCSPCAPGRAVDLTVSAPPEIFGEAADVDGVRYEGYSLYGGPFFSGNLSFTGGPIIAPVLPLDGYAERFAPFTFAGLLRGYDNFALSGPPLFTLDLRGRGTARLEFTNDAQFGLRAARITYEFEAAPVPEPATMFLLGSGLAGLVIARRRKR